MADAATHRTQAIRNWDYLAVNAKFWQKLPMNQGVNVVNEPDWLITIGFYVAVHLCNIPLALKNLHPNTHGNASKELKNIDKLLDDYYDALKRNSEQSRYMKLTIPNSGNISKPTILNDVPADWDTLMDTLWNLNELLNHLSGFQPANEYTFIDSLQPIRVTLPTHFTVPTKILSDFIRGGLIHFK